MIEKILKDTYVNPKVELTQAEDDLQVHHLDGCRLGTCHCDVHRHIHSVTNSSQVYQELARIIKNKEL